MARFKFNRVTVNAVWFCSALILLSSCALTQTGESINSRNSGCDDIEKFEEELKDPAFDDIAFKTVDLRELPCHWFSTAETDNLYQETLISQKFANASFLYAIAAFDAYEKDSKKTENIPFPSKEDWNEIILTKANPDTGFYAKSRIRVMEDGTRELVVSYRGTSGDFTDWSRGNAFFFNFFFIDNQFDNALEFAQMSIELANKVGGFDTLVFTGHSLGGGLAQYAQRYHKSSRAVVFNASPNKGRIYSLIDWITQKLEPVDVLRVYEKSEVLDYLRKISDLDFGYDESPYGPGMKTRWFNFYKGGPVGQHDMQDFALNLIKVAASTNNKYALDIIEKLEKERSQYLAHPYYKLRSPKNVYRSELRQKINNQT